jgi:hypothetical protein
VVSGDNEEVEAELLPGLRDSVFVAIMSAGLVGKRAIINGEASEIGLHDVVFGVETVNDDEAELVFDSGRRVRIDGRIESIRIEWEDV